MDTETLYKPYIDTAYRDFSMKLTKNIDRPYIGVRLPVLRKLAKVFHVTIDSLLSDADETVIRAADLTDEQIDIIDTIIESFRVNNLLRNSAENERAIADVMDNYRALNDKTRSEAESRKGKDKGQNREKAIEKDIE